MAKARPKATDDRFDDIQAPTVDAEWTDDEDLGEFAYGLSHTPIRMGYDDGEQALRSGQVIEKAEDLVSLVDSLAQGWKQHGGKDITYFEDRRIGPIRSSEFWRLCAPLAIGRPQSDRLLGQIADPPMRSGLRQWQMYVNNLNTARAAVLRFYGCMAKDAPKSMARPAENALLKLNLMKAMSSERDAQSFMFLVRAAHEVLDVSRVDVVAGLAGAIRTPSLYDTREITVGKQSFHLRLKQVELAFASYVAFSAPEIIAELQGDVRGYDAARAADARGIAKLIGGVGYGSEAIELLGGKEAVGGLYNAISPIWRLTDAGIEAGL